MHFAYLHVDEICAFSGPSTVSYRDHSSMYGTKLRRRGSYRLARHEGSQYFGHYDFSCSII